MVAMRALLQERKEFVLTHFSKGSISGFEISHTNISSLMEAAVQQYIKGIFSCYSLPQSRAFLMSEFISFTSAGKWVEGSGQCLTSFSPKDTRVTEQEKCLDTEWGDPVVCGLLCVRLRRSWRKSLHRSLLDLLQLGCRWAVPGLYLSNETSGNPEMFPPGVVTLSTQCSPSSVPNFKQIKCTLPLFSSPLSFVNLLGCMVCLVSMNECFYLHLWLTWHALRVISK